MASLAFPFHIPHFGEGWGQLQAIHSDSGNPPLLPVSLEVICSFVGGITGLTPLLKLREKNSDLDHPQWFLPTRAGHQKNSQTWYCRIYLLQPALEEAGSGSNTMESLGTMGTKA